MRSRAGTVDPSGARSAGGVVARRSVIDVLGLLGLVGLLGVGVGDPRSARLDDLRAGRTVTPTRGADSVCSFKQMSRVLAGFSDGRADEGVGAGPASLLGLRIAHDRGWVAPGDQRPDGSLGSRHVIQLVDLDEP